MAENDSTHENTSEVIIAHFDKAAASWEDNPVRLEMAGCVTDAILEDAEMQPGMKVLDFGCGTGLISRGLCEHVAEILAVDASSAMIEVLQQKIDASKFSNITARQVEDIASLDTKFDLIATSMVMHHIDDIDGQLKKFSDLLEDGGQLAVADLSSEDGSFHGDVPNVHHTGFDPDSFSEAIENAGFTLKSLRQVYTVRRPSKTDGQLKSYPLWLWVAGK